MAIVEDDESDFFIYRRLLARVNHDFTEVVHYNHPDEARERLLTEPPACCLMDFRFSDGVATDFISQLHAENAFFPIVISTGMGCERLAVELMQMGVQDYLVKDELSASILLRALNNAMRTFGLQQELEHLAHHDGLTGLLNRTLFMNRIQHSVDEAQRYHRQLGLICLDIDHFKQINDTYGHDVGDTVLSTVAERLKQCVRESDSVARLGGDEFILLLPESNPEKCALVAHKLLGAISKPIQAGFLSVVVTPSIGYASYPGTAGDHTALIKQADIALYQAKARGRAQWVRYSKSFEYIDQQNDTLLKALPRALANGDLKMAYQPVFKSDSLDCVAVEALVRWNLGDRSVAPEQLIATMQNSSLVLPFHHWLFEQTLTQLAQWQRQYPQLKLAINLPVNVLENPVVFDQLYLELKKSSVSPESLVIELTEEQLQHPSNNILSSIHKFEQLGVDVAIDNFGSAHCAIEQLVALPCKQIKIDRHCVLNWDKSDNNRKMVLAISAVAHSMNMEVVAEGVETKKMHEILTGLGCDQVQGYHLGGPAFALADWPSFLHSSVDEGQRMLQTGNS